MLASLYPMSSRVYAACKHDERRKPQTNSGACDPRCRSFAIFSDNMFTVGFSYDTIILRQNTLELLWDYEKELLLWEN